MHPPDMWPEVPDTGDLITNLAVAVATIAGMWLLFREGWRLSELWVWRFKAFSDGAKAEWSARIVSTAHAVVVCPLVVACLITMNFDPVTLVPKGSTTLLEITFSIAIGYFLFDLAIILWWMMPMWPVFVIHHVVIVTPYIYSQFLYICSDGQYVFLLVLLLELSTIPLNAMAFLSDLGKRHSKSHMVAHALMYLTWLSCRVLLPIYLLFVLWTRVVAHFHEEEACVLPALVFVPIAATFCIAIFLFFLTPKIYARLRYGDQEDALCVPARPYVDSEGVVAAEVDGDAAGLGGQHAAGFYHNLGSAEAVPVGPHTLRRESSAASLGQQNSAAISGTLGTAEGGSVDAPSHGIDFREELLLPHQRQGVTAEEGEIPDEQF